ncbi:MAG: YbaB/EbfC family nucleoid-associated protein [Crocinitomicaceae bacterium]|nr:YbaB/EbfC family nucleoid-associated protein [Crocinitomicaceae bacterium]
MFGSGMLDKLNAMKNLAEDSKKRLDSIIVEGEAGDGLIRIELTGNRNLKSISINTDHTQMSKEDLEDLIAVALNKAIEKANNVNEQEVMSSAKSMFPGL